jgi:hypothetical protein
LDDDALLDDDDVDRDPEARAWYSSFDFDKSPKGGRVMTEGWEGEEG